jgi:hypothetical protein
VAAPAARVFSSAVLIEPPICCVVFAVAEATPWSAIRTPSVARLIAVGIVGSGTCCITASCNAAERVAPPC